MGRIKYSKDYYNIKKKKDITTHVKFKNRFVHYPLYDTAKDSHIRKYQMWAKYRDFCNSKGFKVIEYKDFGKILRLIGNKIEDVIINEPEGVVFKHFKIRQEFFRSLINKKKNYLKPVLAYYPKSKKKNSLSLNSWRIFPSNGYRIRIEKALKEGKIRDYDYYKSRQTKKIKLTDFDLFNDF